jgi:hypothetical protein
MWVDPRAAWMDAQMVVKMASIKAGQWVGTTDDSAADHLE